jgi:hypothetical protein
MRAALPLLLLAACEIQPAPPKKAEPPPPPSAMAEAPPPAPPPNPDAGVDAPPRIEITPDCLAVGVKVAQVFIDGASDPAQKSIYEQERANMTRKTGEACTTYRWSDNARKCYLGTKTPADIKKCEMKYTPPPAPVPVKPTTPGRPE